MISIPASVPVGKKKFILNLNNYRNAHYQVLNKSKVNYTALLSCLNGLNLPEQIKITYTYFHGTKGRVDVSNVCSIADKYFSDALVHYKCIPDDDVEHIKEVTYRWGGYDKGNPHFIVEIEKV